MFILSGKKRIASMLRTGKATPSALIMSENYYLSNIDIILLSQHYRVPLVLFSSTSVAENKSPILVAYTDGHASFYFIKAPGVQIDTPMKYKLVVAPTGAKIRIDQLSGTLKDQLIKNDGYSSIEELLSSQVVGTKSKTIRKLKIVDKLDEPPTKARKTQRKIVLK